MTTIRGRVGGDLTTYSFQVASQSEAEAGTDNVRTMTPLRTAQAIAALAASLVPDFATQAEALAGASDTTIVSPLRLAQYIASLGAPLYNLAAVTAPTTGDNYAAGYSFGSMWWDATTGVQWACVGDGEWVPDTPHPGVLSGLFYPTFRGVMQTASVAPSTTLAYYQPFSVDEDVVVGSTSCRVTTGAYLVTGTSSGVGGTVRLTFGAAGTTGLTTGDTRTVAGVGGTTEANGTWSINVINSTQIDLVGTTYANAWTSGGYVQVGIKHAIYESGSATTGRGRPFGAPILEATGAIGASNTDTDSIASASALLRKRRRYWIATKLEAAGNATVRFLTSSSTDFSLEALIGRTSISGTTGVSALTLSAAYSDAWPTHDGSETWGQNLGNGPPVVYLGT